MAQNDPNDPNSGIGSGTTGNIGSGGTSTGAGYSSGGTGTGMSSGGGMTTGSGGTSSDLGGSSGFGVTSGSDLLGGSAGGGDLGGGSTAGTGSTGSATGEEFCAHCGQSLNKGGGIEGLLSGLRSQLGNVDVDEYLNTAREYLKGSSNKVTTYTKENPAKVAAGVAALALGAGLIYAAVNREKTDTSNATTDTMSGGAGGTNSGDSTGGTGGIDTSRDRGL
jgi:hypothetical protein